MALERPDIDVSGIINRMKEVLGINTDSELANYLDISNKTISSWRNRNSIPMDLVVAIGFATDTPVEYIVAGVSVKSVPLTYKELDLQLAIIIGEKVFRSIMGEYAAEKLASMEEREIQVEGVRAGTYIVGMYEFLLGSKEALVDKAGVSIKSFVELERQRPDYTNDTGKKLRDRFREGKE